MKIKTKEEVLKMIECAKNKMVALKKESGVDSEHVGVWCWTRRGECCSQVHELLNLAQKEGWCIHWITVHPKYRTFNIHLVPSNGSTNVDASVIDALKGMTTILKGMSKWEGNEKAKEAFSMKCCANYLHNVVRNIGVDFRGQGCWEIQREDGTREYLGYGVDGGIKMMCELFPKIHNCYIDAYQVRTYGRVFISLKKMRYHKKGNITKATLFNDLLPRVVALAA